MQLQTCAAAAAYRFFLLGSTSYAYWNASVVFWLKLLVLFAVEMLSETRAIQQQGVRTEFALQWVSLHSIANAVLI